MSGALAVLGAGSWGTALAVHLAGIGHSVRLWGRDASLVAALRTQRMNASYLPGVPLPTGVEPVEDLGAAVAGTRFVVAAMPSHGARDVFARLVPHIPGEALLISAIKGLETDSLMRMSELMTEAFGSRRPVVVLSGPSFALELARRCPTAVVVASSSAPAAGQVQHEFRSPYFRLYASDDVAGVEIGGAMKNVIAIAAGATEALGLGHNALAALVTRGLAEISRLACAAGGRRDTLAGLSGLGDLVLTCTGDLSRNRRVGLELGRGRPLKDVLGEMRMVAEGVRTTAAALALGERYGVELPITAQMADVFAGRKTPRSAVEDLMVRRQRAESDDAGFETCPAR